MSPALILLTIWGVLVIFVGIFIHRGNNIFPRKYSVPNDPRYLKYLGNKIIIAGFVIIFFSAVVTFAVE